MSQDRTRGVGCAQRARSTFGIDENLVNILKGMFFK